jgi:ATP-dependent DNA helicase RecG
MSDANAPPLSSSLPGAAAAAGVVEPGARSETPRPERRATVSGPAALAALRRVIETLCQGGLDRLDLLDEPPACELQAQLGPEAAEHSQALAQVLLRLAAQKERAGAEVPSRPRRLADSLLRYSVEMARLSEHLVSERQRLLAAGMRLVAVVGMELGPSTPPRKAKPPSALAAAPIGGRATSATAPTAATEKVAPPAAKPTPTSPAAVSPKSVSSVGAQKPAAKPVDHHEDTAVSAVPVDADRETLLGPLLGQPGIGPSTAEKLAARGLHRVIDALYFLPRRWDDLRQVVRVGQLVPGVLQSTVVSVERCRVVWARKRFLEATFRGEDGEPLLARWFSFFGMVQKRLQPGARFLLVATPQRFRNQVQVVHPELTELPPAAGTSSIEASSSLLVEGSELGQVRVRYAEVEGVPPRTLSRLCQTLCQRYAELVPDGVPAQLLRKLSLPSLPESLRALHLLSAQHADELPTQQLELLNQGLAPPQRRLIFEELFFLQLGLCQRRQAARVDTATPCVSGPEVLTRLRSVLPFTPTGAQERAIAEIKQDLAQPHPMQRLLHGDVGSGKTLVAYAACELTMAAGHQAALMAPTEILAEQHKRTLTPWAVATGRRIALLTATTPKTARKSTLAQLRAGKFAEVWQLAEQLGQPLDRESILTMLAAGFLQLVIGTHALLAERVEFADLGLVVIDEQHRFGVQQRAALRKKGTMPHLLVMTATPIPRTLALTLYGDLDVTQLDELPPGRTPPVTRVLSGSAGEAKAIATMQRALALGRQAYWVCPLIEESDKLELANATARHATLVEALPSYRVGLVHGRLSTDEREEVMEAFRQGQVHALVATTVIEVGVDVPNASLMVVESAERFGLAQLHQLRGRIGRGSGASACLLLHGSGNEGAGTGSDFLSDGEEDEPRAPVKRSRKKAAATETAPSPSGSGTTSAARLAVLAQSSNGFHIAEADLRIRGPGEVLGTRQAGLPPLRYADLLRDIDLLQIARREATALLARDPALENPEHKLMKQVLKERWESAAITLE